MSHRDDRPEPTTELANAPASFLAPVKVASLIRRGIDDLLRRENAERLFQEGWSQWDQEGPWYDEGPWYAPYDYDYFLVDPDEADKELELLKQEMYKPGFECFERANAQDPDHPGIQSALGEAYYFGLGVPRNFRLALECYGKAAARGNASAQCSLGRMYLHGHGVPKDSNKATEWYRKASRTQGNPSLQVEQLMPGVGSRSEDVKL